MSNQALMVSGKAKIPCISIKADREGNGNVLTTGDYHSVIIIKSAPGFPGSVLTQVPGGPGLAVHWVRPLSPLSLPKPRPGGHS